MGGSGDMRGIKLDGLEDALFIFELIRKRMANEPLK
jgi:hypothetical protein